MDYSLLQVFLIALGYLLFLFAVAWVTDKGWVPSRIVRHPAIYVFSLGVYASAWAIYGSIGFAQAYGYNFLAYFLGLSGAFMLGPILLAPILRLTSTHQLGSLADLFAFRFRSRMVGAATTVLMLLGMLPLLALQIKAVTESIQLLTGVADLRRMALGFCVLIMLFAILFGARHATARQKHEGLVMAIATESVIKIVAFVAIALLGLFGSFGGLDALNQWLVDTPEALYTLYGPLKDNTWHTTILAFFVSAVVMPHMFHMTFTENLNPRALVTASWGLPLLLLVIALCIPIIIWAAMHEGLDSPADFFALALGGQIGYHGALLAYLAGLAGASGMLIVATLALSSMALNNLVLPVRRRGLDERLYRWLLWARRLLICAVLLAAYLFYLSTGNNHSLTELAVLSFVATLQFVPGLIGVLFWPAANRRGVLWGLYAGFLIWALMLFFPTMVPQWQPSWLYDLLRISGHSMNMQWHHITIASVLANALVFVAVSLLSQSSQSERAAADACIIGSLRRPFRWELAATSVPDFVAALTEPLGPATAQREVTLALRDLGFNDGETRPYALRRLRDRVETNLSGLLGPAVAHQIMDDVLPYKAQKENESDEDIQFIEARLELYRDRLSGLAAELDSLRRFHRQTLLELPMGVISLGSDGEIIGWNHAMEQLTGVSALRITGSRLSDLGEDWSETLCRFAQGSATREPAAEVSLRGQQCVLSLHKSQVQGDLPAERSGGLVIVIEDITDLHELEAQLTHNERLASIGRLAAGVAHEIGNPVTAIACLAQNIDHDEDLADIRQTSRQIVEQTRRISRIVESLVTFSHSGGTPQHALNMPVDVQATVSEAIELLKMDPERRRQQFENHCPPGLAVRGDAQRLLQVFVNLLANAADASQPEDPVRVSAQAGEHSIDILVEDHGHGIPAELRDALFEPFATSKPVGRGTGLGLALVYSIIEDHFGSIRAESPIADQRGTRFVITLPGFQHDT
ncbi:ATP-binding protein [Isoalcanivorax beigongshangi]|uniref:histidine kinase n=1 Tax=Isoalcanivorax beigongshangi TaxID=3238810 RepID=A0ABV4AKH5_9GAMM